MKRTLGFMQLQTFDLLNVSQRHIRSIILAFSKTIIYNLGNFPTNQKVQITNLLGNDFFK